VAITRDHDVVGFQIAMDNSGRMGPSQTFGSVLQKPEQLSEFSAFLMNLLAQGDAIDKLHRDEVHALALANFMDGCDVRMIERGRGLRFLFEAPHPILIGSQISGKNFQGNLAMQPRIFREIHLAHPARANLRPDFVTTEFCA
jgi:hypothetical protein